MYNVLAIRVALRRYYDRHYEGLSGSIMFGGA